MGNKHNHTCIMCGTTYKFCPNCSEYDRFPRWMSLYCSQNCHDIFETANDFEHGNINKEEAKKKLGELDLSGRKNYDGTIKMSIDKILGEMSKEKKDEAVKVEESKTEEKKFEHKEKVETKSEPKKAYFYPSKNKKN